MAMINNVLVRDFKQGRLLFYWESPEGQKVSPDLKSYDAAVEWWRDAVQADYTGPERRGSSIDRRANDVRRMLNDNQGHNTTITSGRRRTDTLPEITDDRAVVFLDQFKTALTKTQEKE